MTTDAELRAAPLAILINRGCGHIAGIANTGAADHLHARFRQLVGLGYAGWRVEVRPASDSELEGLAEGRRCHRCRLD